MKWKRMICFFKPEQGISILTKWNYIHLLRPDGRKNASGLSNLIDIKDTYKCFWTFIEFREGIKVLDVGCGVGGQIIKLSYLGANCIGLDANKDYVRLINQVRDDFGLNVKGVYGDACNLPFQDEAFDVIMSYQFFEHVTDINQAMKEQMRVLRSGGRLVIEQANLLNPFVLLDLLVKYPRRTHWKYGGIKWLLCKGKVIKNYGGLGWDGKDEDVHTRLWWRMKMKQLSSS